MSLLDMSLSGAVLILAVTVLRAIAVNHLPKRTFLVLWGVALGRLMIPYTLPSALSVYTLLERLTPAREAAVGEAAGPALPMAPATGEVVGGTVPAVLTAASRPVDWLSILWLVGTLGCAAFFAVNYLRCRREFRRSLPVDHVAVQQWMDAHPLRRPVSVRVCERVSTPLTYGVLRPVILLPKATDWDDIQSMDYILAHELVHIRRFDALTKLVLVAALCLHWFDPAVWVMYVLANRDLELSCDEAVVRRLGPDRRSAYAAALIRMEERRSGLAPLYNHFSKNAMEERIIAIMKIRKTSLAALVLAVGLVVGVTAAFATSATPQESNVPPAVGQLSNPLKTTTELQRITSYIDPYDGKTYYSDDNGQTWKEGDIFAQRGYSFDHVEWWTAEEYEAYLEQMKKEFQSMLGEKSWTPTEGWYTWDQARIDAAIAGSEQLLQEIKDGKLVSKPTTDGDAMIQFSYDSRAIDHIAETRSLTSADLSEYGKLGVTFDDDGRMLYQGKSVRWFADGVELADGGWVTRYTYAEDSGTLRLRTVRERKDNGDGSYDPFGALTGIVPIADEEADQYAFLFQSSPIQQTATDVTVTVKERTSEDNNVDFRDAFNEKFGPYGVSFVPSGTFGNIYWNDQLVNVFVDLTPNGNYQTLSSLASGGIDLQAVYDSDGRLTGVAEVKRELKNLADEPEAIQEFIWEMYKNGLLQENTDYDLSFFAQRAAAEGIADPQD